MITLCLAKDQTQTKRIQSNTNVTVGKKEPNDPKKLSIEEPFLKCFRCPTAYSRLIRLKFKLKSDFISQAHSDDP